MHASGRPLRPNIFHGRKCQISRRFFWQKCRISRNFMLFFELPTPLTCPKAYSVFAYLMWLTVIFTARCHASAVLAMGLCLCLCLSVCLSVTSRSSTKTAKRRITETKPHDSPGTLVFWCQRSPRNSTGVTPYEGAECRGGGSKSATFDKYPAISRKR